MDVRRQRHLARRRAVEPEQPAALAEMLESSTGPSAGRPKTPRRPREPLPLAVAPSRSSSSTSPRAGSHRGVGPRRHDARVVDDRELSGGQLVGQLAEDAVLDLAGRRAVDEQPRLVAPRGRVLREQLLREARSRGAPCSSDGDVTVAADGRRRTGTRSAAPREDRCRRPLRHRRRARAFAEQVEALAATAELEASLPDAVGERAPRRPARGGAAGLAPHRRGRGLSTR